MTDLEISKALALAIGWNGNCVRSIGGGIYIYSRHFGWRAFSHLDWSVIGPIAAKYNVFPCRWSDGRWGSTQFRITVYEDTPQKAIALAVIGSSGK